MFIGTILHKHLKFHEHVLFLTKKAADGIRILINVCNFFNIKTLLSLYCVLVHTCINYCIIIAWGNTYPVHLSPLQHTHNQAIRVMTRSSCTSVASLRPTYNGVLSVAKVNKYSLGIRVRISISGKLPIPIITNSQFPYSMSIRFTSTNSYLLPKPRTSYGKFPTNFSAT